MNLSFAYFFRSSCFPLRVDIAVLGLDPLGALRPLPGRSVRGGIGVCVHRPILRPCMGIGAGFRIGAARLGFLGRRLAAVRYILPLAYPLYAFLDLLCSLVLYGVAHLPDTVRRSVCNILCAVLNGIPAVAFGGNIPARGVPHLQLYTLGRGFGTPSGKVFCLGLGQCITSFPGTERRPPSGSLLPLWYGYAKFSLGRVVISLYRESWG